MWLQLSCIHTYLQFIIIQSLYQMMHLGSTQLALKLPTSCIIVVSFPAKIHKWNTITQSRRNTFLIFHTECKSKHSEGNFCLVTLQLASTYMHICRFIRVPVGAKFPQIELRCCLWIVINVCPVNIANKLYMLYEACVWNWLLSVWSVLTKISSMNHWTLRTFGKIIGCQSADRPIIGWKSIVRSTQKESVNKLYR